MNIIKKMIIFIKNIFMKQNEVKKLQEPRTVIEQNKEKEKFIQSLKINTIKEKTKKDVETLICNGDGLGIQKKISC